MGAPSRTPAVEAAAEQLYGLPLSRFTAERKELAKKLRAGGDRDAAKAVEALPRPSVSAWVVNQLQRHDRADLDALFDAAEELRAGRLDARDPHRDALARLRGRAAQVLVTDGHGASEATLRRVATTLQALAALGTFDPDLPGQLVADRDPPGFDTMAAALGAAEAPSRSRAPARAESPSASDDVTEGDADSRRAAAEERARAEKARERALAVERASKELTRVEAALSEARRVVDARERDVREAAERLRRAEDARDAAAARVSELDDERARASASLAELTEARDSSR